MCPASLLDQLIVEQAHDQGVHVRSADEMGPAETTLLLEPDLLVGSDPPGIGLVHVKLHPLEIHLPKSEPTDRSNRVRPISLAPGRLSNPDPQLGPTRTF